MRFEHLTIPLVPLSTSNCLDLALAYLRQHFAAIARCWAVVAVPACWLAYVLVDRFEGNVLQATALTFFATGPLGVLVIAGAAPAAFGEPFTFRGAWRRLRGQRFRIFSTSLLLRLGGGAGGLLLLASAKLSEGLAVVVGFVGVLLFVPGVWLALRKGFFVEQAVLAHLDRSLHDRRTSELIQGNLGDLFARGIWIVIWCGLVWWTLFMSVDFLSQYLLGFPILFGRMQVDMSYLEEPDRAMQYLGSFLWNDPRVVTAFVATALAVYPLGRLAWFFCYIDVRVRRDCWDMELQITQEAQRLLGEIAN